VNRKSLTADLRRLGLRPGTTVLVHCSLHQVGWLPDGAATLRRAILRVITGRGTLAVPTHTAGNSNTSHQFRRATPAEQAMWEDKVEPFDPATSPSHEMGALAEEVRTQPETLRSRHPHTSFAALGPGAAELTAVHDLTCHLGERSPVAALYRAHADVLMIGVGYDHCTTFHLGEYRATPPPRERPHRCWVREADGSPRRIDFLAPHLDDHDFPELGKAFDGTGVVREGPVGNAHARIFPIRAAVDFAQSWMTGHRGPPAGYQASSTVDIVDLHR
jgi:aminoglycoside 3-N-acetyltransferase